MTMMDVPGKWVVAAAGVAAGLLFTGCASAPTRAYTGPERPMSQVARICIDQTTPPPAYSGRTSEKATIRALDGREIKGEGLAAHPKEILVLPGQHQLLARVAGGANAMGALGSAMMENAARKWDAPLDFKAEPGRTYMVRFEYVKGPGSPAKEEYFNRNKGKLWVYWIEEPQTRRHICGWRSDLLNQ